MIQEADVGIGIVGKEGLQASLAADYSIKEFNFIFGMIDPESFFVIGFSTKLYIKKLKILRQKFNISKPNFV